MSGLYQGTIPSRGEDRRKEELSHGRIRIKDRLIPTAGQRPLKMRTPRQNHGEVLREPSNSKGKTGGYVE
jgi:hypothetical protein